jgi:ABC-2 type transport system permease protein
MTSTSFSWIRVYAVISRYLLVAFRDFRTVSQDFFWPLVDITLWGFAALYACKTSGNPSVYLYSTVACVTLWQLFLRANFEVSISMLDEIVAKNLVSFFASPLRLIEWIVATSILAGIRMITTMIIAVIIIKLLFSWMFLSVGIVLLPFIINVFLFGLTVGYFTAALLMLFGKKIDALAWMMGWVFAPFSSIYYPAETLPDWMNSVANCLPLKYTADALKQAIIEESINWNFLLKSFELNLIYLAMTIFIFLICFEQSRKRGLSRLE